MELAYTRVIVATCFRLVFVLFSSGFRLFAVFISRWSEYGLGEDRARRAFGEDSGRWVEAMSSVRANGRRVRERGKFMFFCQRACVGGFFFVTLRRI